MTEQEFRPLILDARRHERDSAGLVYVYPVVSRRAGGVSVGVNLNTNNACNWRCVYCQVPDLQRGRAPDVDLARLGEELRGFLDDALRGDFMLERVPEDSRRLVDVALSGNGESTSCDAFPEVVELIAEILAERGLAGSVKLRLITNGSLVGKARVQAGLLAIAKAGGEVWFKLDSATRLGTKRINDVDRDPRLAESDLRRCASLCDTWVQTCMFRMDGMAPDEAELSAYCALLERVGVSRLKGVLLYGIARPSMQAEAQRLSPLTEVQLDRVAERLRGLGLTVTVSP